MTPSDKPTWKHVFLIAMPGSVVPLTMTTDMPKPRSTAEEEHLIAQVAAEVKSPPEYVTFVSSRCLEDEPYPADPPLDLKKKPSPIVVPMHDRLIVPNGR